MAKEVDEMEFDEVADKAMEDADDTKKFFDEAEDVPMIMKSAVAPKEALTLPAK